MRRAMFLGAGVLWLLFAVGFGFVLLQYLGLGAGLQFYGGMFSSGSVLVGLIHVVGFIFAALLCLVIGAGLFARGMAGRAEDSDDYRVP